MLDQRAEAVRGFNRFYTKQIGLLHKGYLESPFSLAEMRVLYELAHREGLTATELSGDLDLDPGYLSRMLLGFKKRGYLRKTAAEDDQVEFVQAAGELPKVVAQHGDAIVEFRKR